MANTEYPINTSQLVTGLFVRLNLPEGKSPFKRNSFKIKSDEQIAAIKKLGLKTVICILEKSDRMPPSPEGEGDGRSKKRKAKLEKGKKTPVSAELLGLKRETVERNRERRKHYRRTEKKYEKTMGSVVTILRRASGRSSEAAAEAREVVSSLVDTFLADRDTMISLVGSKSNEEAKNYHALNVTVLSMMVGKDLKLPARHMHSLGLGALFHDIGKGRVPIQSMSKQATSMNKAAAKYYLEHPIVGARLVTDFMDFPKASVQVVLQHHEMVDGSGYPKKLKGADISPLARVVAVTNQFDKLVNDPRAEENMTPHEAIRHLYSNFKDKFDSKVLSTFIRNMGVYPPGTVVKLSNGQFGMVTGVNPRHAARPTVIMYHPEIPKDEAILVDMVIEDELEVAATLKPGDLPREVFSYLSPSRNINYYAEAVPEG